MLLSWFNVSQHKKLKIYLVGRNIYKAYHGEFEEEVSPELLCGDIILNTTPETIKLTYWVVYKSMNGQVSVCPIDGDDVAAINANRDVLQHPIDIRLFIQMMRL